MDRIANAIVTHRKRFLAATGLLTLLAATMLFRMSFEADVTAALAQGSDVGRSFAELHEKYDSGDPITVLVTLPEGRTFAEPAALAELLELSRDVATIDGVASVASIVPDAHPITGAPMSPELLRAMPAFAIQGGLLESPIAELLISEDRRETMMMVVPKDDGVALPKALRAWSDGDPPGDFGLLLSGTPIVFETVLGMLTWFLLAIPPCVVILLLGTFFATIGDKRLAVFAILPALFGSLWTFGVIFGLGLKVDLVTILVPIYVIVMGSADGLHFVTHYQEEVARTPDPVERVRTTLRQIGVPMILTTVSTAAGFLSLLVAEVRPIQQLGLFTAIGISFAGLISFFFLPALLSGIDIEPKASRAVLGPRVLRGLRYLVVRPRVALVLSLTLIVFSAVFIPRIHVLSDPLFMFPEDHSIRQDFARVEQALGGATPLMGEFAWTAGGTLDDLAPILAASRELEALPGVRRVFSAADLAHRLAATSPERAAAVLAGEMSTPMGSLVSEDGLRFVLFPSEFESVDVQGWLDYAAGSDLVRSVTGLPVLWDTMARQVLRAQIGSLITAFALVVLMLFIAYRRVRETLVSLAPLVLTIGTLLGFLAASGIQLHMVTAVVSAIVLGVGIDYAIHLVAAIDHARPDGPGYVLRAIDKAGRPIVANALGISLGLTALWLSPFKIHGQISMIMWVSMTVAALTALLVIPALGPRIGLETPPD